MQHIVWTSSTLYKFFDLNFQSPFSLNSFLVSFFDCLFLYCNCIYFRTFLSHLFFIRLVYPNYTSCLFCLLESVPCTLFSVFSCLVPSPAQILTNSFLRNPSSVILVCSFYLHSILRPHKSLHSPLWFCIFFFSHLINFFLNQ